MSPLEFDCCAVTACDASQIVDAKKASYGVDNALFAVTQLAQTTMRSDIGKISLDKTFEERDTLNRNIVEAIRRARRAERRGFLPIAAAWQILTMRADALGPVASDAAGLWSAGAL